MSLKLINKNRRKAYRTHYKKLFNESEEGKKRMDDIITNLTNLISTTIKQKKRLREKVIQEYEEFLFEYLSRFGIGSNTLGRNTRLSYSLKNLTIEAKNKSSKDFYESIRYEEIAKYIKVNLEEGLETAFKYPSSPNVFLIPDFGRIQLYSFILIVKQRTGHINFRETNLDTVIEEATNALSKTVKITNLLLKFKHFGCKQEILESLKKEKVEKMDSLNIDKPEEHPYQKMWRYGDKNKFDEKWQSFVSDSEHNSDNGAAKIIIGKFKKEFPNEEKYPAPKTVKDHYSPNR